MNDEGAYCALLATWYCLFLYPPGRFTSRATPDWIRKTSSFCWLHPRYIWLLISQTLKRQFKLSSNARLAWKAATCTVPIRRLRDCGANARLLTPRFSGSTGLGRRIRALRERRILQKPIKSRTPHFTCSADWRNLSRSASWAHVY